MERAVRSGFAVKLGLAAALVIALAGAVLWLGRPAPRNHAGGDETATAVEVAASPPAGTATGAAPAPRAPASPSVWRWLLGDRGAPEPAVAAAGGGGTAGESAAPSPSGNSDPGGAPMPRARSTYQDRRPSRDPANDDSSPTLAKVIEVTQATPTQQARIRELWRAHEEARRHIFAKMMPSVAPPEVKMKLELEAADGDFELTLIREVLDQAQADRLVAEFHPPPSPH